LQKALPGMEREAKFNRVRVPARAGYTLVELMIIVMIIAISTLAFTPGFSRAMADRRVSLAARELIRVGRRARADTFGYLRAHLVWINPGARTIQLLRGPNNSCTVGTDWSNIGADCGANWNSGNAQRCIENVFISSMEARANRIGLFVEVSAGGAVNWSTTPRAICYAPSGVVYYGSGANLAAAASNTVFNGNSAAGAIGGGFVFSLVSGTSAPDATNSAGLRIHRVLFPMGGSPRSVR
jgi:type II secretory pathway pseudopilin PulG